VFVEIKRGNGCSVTKGEGITCVGGCGTRVCGEGVVWGGHVYGFKPCVGL